MVFENWANVIASTWINIWERFIAFLPNLIGAILILIIGWLLGVLIAMLVDKALRAAGLQTLFEKARVENILRRGGIEQDSTSLLAAVVKWIIYLIAFIAAANTLGLSDVANFLDRILAYVPEVIAAAAILVIGFVLANFLSAVVKGSVQASGLDRAQLISSAVRYSIVIFTVLAALSQLGIAEGLIQTLFIGFVAFLAIAGGLSFGLGGKDAAQDVIQKVRKDIK